MLAEAKKDKETLQQKASEIEHEVTTLRKTMTEKECETREKEEMLTKHQQELEQLRRSVRCKLKGYIERFTCNILYS